MIKKILDDFIKYAYADTELRLNIINLSSTHEKLNNDKSQTYFKNKKLYESLYYNNIQIKDIIYKMSTIFINKDKVYNNKKLLIKRLHEISDELE